MICHGDVLCPDPASCAAAGACQTNVVTADRWLEVVGRRNPRLVKSYPHLFEGVGLG